MSGTALEGLDRLVVKIGSSLLVDEEGAFDGESLRRLADEVAALRQQKHEVLLVSSGAVALGCQVLGIERRRARLDELQAAAAAGQVQLVLAWQEALARHDISAAQVLLTPDDSESRRRFLNAQGTLKKLLEHGAIPVINENDTVATDELRYGDNDRMAARVAQMVMADGLVLLSDVDGLYTSDPRQAGAEHIAEVPRIDDGIIAMAGDAGSVMGSGGMRTKVEAARIATHAGCTTIVANGRASKPLSGIANGVRHTVFLPEGTPAAARKQWLAGRLEVRGSIEIDDGAARALAGGSSLLPVGVARVNGQFRRGDAVTLVATDGTELGRGLAAYDSEEMQVISGCRSEEIASRLGYHGRSVAVHRDDLVFFRR